MKQLLNKYIDHTLLKATATEEEIIKLCKEAKEYNFCSVCVNSYHVKTAFNFLKNEDNIKICAVVGFPLGANTLETKLYEAHTACLAGASEIDMVINIAELKNKNIDYCIKEINSIKQAIGNKNILKVIVETAYLNQDEKRLAAEIILNSKADFIKTSTGFASAGAQIDDIKLWKSILGDNKKIKASGGIKNYNTCLEFIKAGADRIGTSSGVEIMTNIESNQKY